MVCFHFHNLLSPHHGPLSHGGRVLVGMYGWMCINGCVWVHVYTWMCVNGCVWVGVGGGPTCVGPGIQDRTLSMLSVVTSTSSTATSTSPGSNTLV